MLCAYTDQRMGVIFKLLWRPHIIVSAIKVVHILMAFSQTAVVERNIFIKTYNAWCRDASNAYDKLTSVLRND